MKPNIFQTVLLPKPKRAKFDLSHERKMTMPFGALVPTFVSEVLPGDSFDVDSKMLARFQALLAPPMHRVNVFTHFFWVPYRVINNEWTRFITYQGNRPNSSNGVSATPYILMSDLRTAVVNGAAGNALKDGSLLDYLGFPTAPNDLPITAGSAFYEGLRINMLFPLAYQRIWNDYYRDQNFTQPLFSEDGTSTNNAAATYLNDVTQLTGALIPDPEATTVASTVTTINAALTLRWRAWEKDYLTSALPYANQGVGDPRVPITVPAGTLGATPVSPAVMPTASSTFGQTGGIQYPGQINNPSDLGGFTISALRVATALKRWLENTARGGSRYVENLWNHWNVQSSDARAMQAQYLGGGMQPMVISEVVTTAPNSAAQPGVVPGYLAGHGISYGSTNQFRKKFEEHGVVMGITSIIPRTSYLYSLPRAFMRTEPLDYAFPEFAQLGEQPVLGSEVFFKINSSGASVSAPNYTGANMTQSYAGITSRFAMGYQAPASYYGFDLQNDQPQGLNNTWGFQSRYAEYKYQPDTVHGLFRNNQSFWTFGRMLTPNTLLNNAFVTSNPRMDNFAILPNNGGAGQYNQHPILLNVYNRVSVVRSLPYYNTPTLW